MVVESIAFHCIPLTTERWFHIYTADLIKKLKSKIISVNNIIHYTIIKCLLYLVSVWYLCHPHRPAFGHQPHLVPVHEHLLYGSLEEVERSPSDT